VTTFVSPVPDPRAYAVDAMSLSWEGMFAYAFPPFRFLTPVLHKITGEKCRIIVIAPADFVLREALVAWHRTDTVDLRTKLILPKLEQ
jgi:hypothetical protein